MRILVTGAEGFVGSGFTFDDDMRVDLRTGRDILDPATGDMIRAFDPHIVFHLAAHHYIPWCDEHPSETLETNGVGTALVLQACGPSLQSFVLASSAAVYGFGPTPFVETDRPAGDSVYARSKQRAEAELLLFSSQHPTVRCVAARLFNIVGPGDTWPHILPVIAANRQHQIKLGNVWPLRDYVHVDDVRDALAFLADTAPIGFGAYNVGTGEATSVTMLARMVAERSHTEIDYEVDKHQSRTDDGHLIADVSKTAALGWSAERSLIRAIDDLLEVSPAVP